MRIVGERPDGVLHVKLATGLAVLVDPATTYVSKAIDESEADQYGPWQETDNSLDRRRHIQRVLDRGKHQPVRMFSTQHHGQ